MRYILGVSTRKMYCPRDQRRMKVKWLPEHVAEEIGFQVKYYMSMDTFLMRNLYIFLRGLK